MRHRIPNHKIPFIFVAVKAKQMHTCTLPLQQIDASKHPLTGGKAANLGELFRIDGIMVPDGFCITTDAYAKIIENTPGLTFLLNGLTHLKPDETKQISNNSAAIRTAIENTPVPSDIADEIGTRLEQFPANQPFAVRSSATAEDLPTTSFAGQQDSYLNVIGKEPILRHIRKCWASLFTDRAVIYRLRNGFDHHKVSLAVIVQKMVFPQAAGILFTADPVTGNRRISSIDAGFGLGEALVSGLVNADVYKVANNRIIEKKISAKQRSIVAQKEGGTRTQPIDAARQKTQTLTDPQLLQLESIGRTIEGHFGRPQDIEWCLAGDIFYIVQSRPITTLYPIPEANDQANHIYISVGHQQMMTDAMKPLGLSFFLLTTSAPMRTAGGRLFVDIMKNLASPATREKTIAVLGGSDPLLKDALTILVEREDLLKTTANDAKSSGTGDSNKVISWTYPEHFENGPAIVADLIKSNQNSLKHLTLNIRAKSGTALFEFILEDLRQSKKELFNSRNLDVIMIAMNAATWLNEKMMAWLGEKNAADAIAQSAPNNITAEMGLELLDVADAIRPYPEVIDYLQKTTEDRFLDDLPKLKGGTETRDAICTYLSKYGMRCAGEIDITKTRWAEKPITLVPLILNNIKKFEPYAAKRKFEQGRRNALRKEKELLDRLRQLADGEQKVTETKRMIVLIRDLAGYREYPKYGIVSRYFIYKQALLKEAEHLVKTRALANLEDIFFLTFEEFREAVHTSKLDHQTINHRKEEYRHFERLSPPRVMTSDGEIITGKYKTENLPPDAIAGLAVSSGIVEGRARVILKMEEASLQDGDILVTTFTDPSWTPLFVSIKGLVTEVGGLMTHGAVIAREYGLPAVVGVENATTLIKDGQRIRVNGTDGYVQIL